MNRAVLKTTEDRVAYRAVLKITKDRVEYRAELKITKDRVVCGAVLKITKDRVAYRAVLRIIKDRGTQAGRGLVSQNPWTATQGPYHVTQNPRSGRMCYATTQTVLNAVEGRGKPATLDGPVGLFHGGIFVSALVALLL